MKPFSYFQPVDEATLNALHTASLQVLEQTGVSFELEECLKLLADNGARIDGKTARLPAGTVEKAITTAPSSFPWLARDEEKSIRMDVNDPTLHVAMNNGPLFIQDEDRGRRMGSEQDLINLYKLGQQSSVCDIVGQIPVAPDELNGSIRHLQVFRDLLNHSDKPLFGYVGDAGELEQMFTMIKIAHGGDDTLFDDPRIAVSLNPLSPLQFDRKPCETLLHYARHGQIVTGLTCAMTGVSSPVDPMGTVVLQNAELLAALVVTQLVRPGNPFIYAPASAVPDMRTAGYVTGLPVSGLINMVNLQLARQLYRIPTRCMSGICDAKEVDAQAGLETMQNHLMYTMAGANMVNECLGLLDAIMCVSYEKFIIDEEIMERTAQIGTGIASLQEDFSLAEIDKVGQGGTYLMEPSTMAQCRKLWTPPLSAISSYDDWKLNGGENMLQRANRRWKERLAACPESLLDDSIDRELMQFIEHQA